MEDMNHIDRQRSQSHNLSLSPALSATSATAPSQPQQPSIHNTMARVMHQNGQVVPHSTAGQFAYAPATQQTTVVTTTTTTINLAPFILQPPQSLHERDPKLYPLAYTNTPAHLRTLRFKLGEQVASFTEAADAQAFMGEHDHQRRALEQAGGVLKDFEESRNLDSDVQPQANHSTANLRKSGTIASSTRRQNSPPSLAAAVELAESQRRRGKRTTNLAHLPEATPDSIRPSRLLRTSTLRPDANSPTTPRHDTIVPDASGRDQFLTSTSDARVTRSSITPQNIRRSRSRQSARANQDVSANASSSLAAATPPVMDSDVEADEHTSSVGIDHPAIPATLQADLQQDASLPSPSLSPVTAAANLAQRQQLFGRRNPDNDDVSDLSGLDTEAPSNLSRKRKLPPLFDSQSSSGVASLGKELQKYADHEDESHSPPQTKTLMDVPDMISMFDALPHELQGYVMFQLLKRSSKRTLRTVADIVNPALKCDPFDTLPVELSLKITKFLDGQSLGRAAQVSKRWRRLINSDETAWKDLLEREGYTLPDGEIERAVREGWGWQYAGPDGAEIDLSNARSTRASARHEVDQSLVELISDDESFSNTRNLRKRKATAAASAAPTSASKRQKRRVQPSTPQDDEVRWMRDLQKGQGPIAYASAAARAIPDPKIGLSSLRSLHLFKSIYQRHRMIRKTWMDEASQPHHLAFRAHHRHVVTCLLFDSDRIITGSDDTSINVFDTKTGVLRKRLEGHEGGVWALACDGDTLVSGSTDRSVRVWNIKTGECMQTFQGHTSTVRCLVILKPVEIGKTADGTPIMRPEEPIIITGSRDSTLRVWKLPRPDDPPMHQAGPPQNEADNQYALRTLSGHHNSVRAIAAHGDTVISGSYDCTVRVWRIETGEMVHRLQGHNQKVYSVVLDHERGRCISGSMDNLVKVWSLETGMCLFNLEGHTSLVGLLELNHGHLVSAAADSTLRIWDPENGACRNTLSAHTGAITCFQHDGQKVISGSDKTLKMWNIETGECMRDLLTDLSGVWQVRFDERRCVAAVQRNNLTYIEVLDFGASRDGIPAADRSRRIVVDTRGREIEDEEAAIEVAQVRGPGAA